MHIHTVLTIILLIEAIIYLIIIDHVSNRMKLNSTLIMLALSIFVGHV